MKKFLSIVLISMIFLGLCTGCQSEKKDEMSDGAENMEAVSSEDMESQPSDKNETDSEKADAGVIKARPSEDSLKICVDAIYKDSVKGIIEVWEFLNEGVDAELVVIPEEESAAEIKITELQAELMAGGGPDLFIVSCDMPLALEEKPAMFGNPEQVMETNTFLPLDDYIERAQYLDLSAMNQIVMEAGKTGEGQMVLPVTYDYFAYAFRAEDMKDIQQLPSSWEELISCEDKRIADAVGPSLFWAFYDIFGNLVDYENDILAVSEEELLQYVQQAVSYSRDESGKTSASEVLHNNYASELPQILGQDKKEEHIIFGLPNAEGGVTANIKVFAAINRNTDQPENAFSFLDLMFSDELMSGTGFKTGQKIEMSDGSFDDIMIGAGNVLLSGTLYGITVNDKGFEHSIGECSGKDQEAILVMQKQINAVRFYSDIDEELANLYWRCLSANNEMEQMDYVSNAFNSIWMKLSE